MSSTVTSATKSGFYSGHSGTSIQEVNAVIGLVPLMALLFAAAKSATCHHCSATSRAVSEQELRHQQTPSTLWKLAETLAMVLPQIAVTMQLITPVAAIASAGLLVSLVICQRVIAILSTSQRSSQQLSLQAAAVIGEQRARFISKYRGAMMLSTCIAILAVDFPAFPRRFAKSDGFGSGLMDVGVGSFVFASGLVASSASRRAAWSRVSSLHIVALLALGAARVAATRSVGYHETAFEYGVHWNFFFTLAAVKLCTTVVAVPPPLAIPTGVAVMAIHEALLTWGGLSAVVHSSQRGPSLWSLNKEGLLSLPGYWGLHLLAVGMGVRINSSRAAVLQQVQSANEGSSPPWKPLVRWFCIWCAVTILAWAALTFAVAFIAPISRQACNLPYVIWMLAFNLQVVLAFAAGTAMTPECDTLLFESLNRHSLPIFLAANLVTGSINLSTDTLAVTDWSARAIVTCYSIVLCLTGMCVSKRSTKL